MYSEFTVLSHFSKFLEFLYDNKLIEEDDLYSYEDFGFTSFNGVWSTPEGDYRYSSTSGAFKAVFHIDSPIGNEWILKIPFLNGETFLWEGCDNEDAPSELDIYQEAIEWGVEEFFAKPTSFATISLPHFEVPFYAAELMTVDSDRIISESKVSLLSDPFVENLLSNSEIFSEAVAAVSGYYSEEDIERFFEFCHWREIYDLHSENFGYDKWEKPVVIDYN